MLYTPRGSKLKDIDEDLYQALEALISGMGMSLIELSIYRGKRSGNFRSDSEAKLILEARAIAGTVQVKLVVYKDGSIGVDDCSRVHRAILPRLELAFPCRDISVEVSSPGIDRLIKDGSEFVHYVGKGVRCYRTDISDWTAGTLQSASETGIVLKTENTETALEYGIIAKARLSGEA